MPRPTSNRNAMSFQSSSMNISTKSLTTLGKSGIDFFLSYSCISLFMLTAKKIEDKFDGSLEVTAE